MEIFSAEPPGFSDVVQLFSIPEDCYTETIQCVTSGILSEEDREEWTAILNSHAVVAEIDCNPIDHWIALKLPEPLVIVNDGNGGELRIECQPRHLRSNTNLNAYPGLFVAVEADTTTSDD